MEDTGGRVTDTGRLKMDIRGLDISARMYKIITRLHKKNSGLTLRPEFY